VSARVSPRRVIRRILDILGVKCQASAGGRRRATSRTSRTSVATGTQKISKAGGSFNRAAAVRPELKRRASRQAAAGRCRSSVASIWIVDGGADFLHLAGDPSQFVFQVPSAAPGSRRRCVRWSMTTDVRWGGSPRPMLLLAYALRTAVGELT
jgi:hypothetical protein